MIQLPIVDLSTATVGATGLVSWPAANVEPTITQRQQNIGASLQFFNESGCGLSLAFPGSGQTTFLPAGAWLQHPLPAANTIDSFTYSVQYIIPNAPVTALIVIYYAPGEDLASNGTLGNSPIGISGQVATSTGQSIKNDGNAPGTQIIESTPSDQGSSSFNLANDGSGFWQVLSAGVLRKVLNIVRGNSGVTKASVSVGDSGDTSITTFYGSLSGTIAAATSVPTGQLSAGDLPAGVTVPTSHIDAGTLPAGVALPMAQLVPGQLGNGSGNITVANNIGMSNSLMLALAGNAFNVPPANADYLGSGALVGTENETQLVATDKALSLIGGGGNGIWFKYNTYWDGANDRFIDGTNYAYAIHFAGEITYGGYPMPCIRWSTAHSTLAGSIVSWGQFIPLGFMFYQSSAPATGAGTPPNIGWMNSGI